MHHRGSTVGTRTEPHNRQVRRSLNFLLGKLVVEDVFVIADKLAVPRFLTSRGWRASGLPVAVGVDSCWTHNPTHETHICIIFST